MKIEFKCRSKTEFDDGIANSHFEVVQDGSDINKATFKGYPGGFLDVQAITQEAAAEISVGKRYIVSVTEVK